MRDAFSRDFHWPSRLSPGTLTAAAMSAQTLAPSRDVLRYPNGIWEKTCKIKFKLFSYFSFYTGTGTEPVHRYFFE